MKINLIIDTNNLFYQSTDISRYATRLGMTYPKTELKLGSPEALAIFKDKIDTDFRILLNSLPKPDNLIFCLDSSSWRKKIEIKGEFLYKKNREKKNEEIDWNAFNTGILNLIQNFEGKALQIYGLEADDIVALINERLLKEDRDCINIIVSTDGDFRQILQERTIICNLTYKNTRLLFSDKFTLEDLKNHQLLYESSKNSKLFQTKNIFDVSDINFSKNSGKGPFEILTDNYDSEVVSRSELLFSKIIKGDDKDYVPSTWYWKGSKDNVRRITQTHVNKVIEFFEDNDLEITVKNLFLNINNIHKILQVATKQEIDLKEFTYNLKLNYKLLVLSRKTIPSDLVETFDALYEEHFY